MILIPGWLISLLTAPGVVVHEAAHMIFCRISGVAIFDVCYFRIGNPAGYVIHEVPESFVKNFFISVGPFFINSLLCILICFPAVIPVRVFGHNDPLTFVLMYFGLAVGMHAIPSTGDAKGLWRTAKVAAKQLHPLAILSFPLIILIYVANALRIVWADLAYGFAIGFLLPDLLLKHI